MDPSWLAEQQRQQMEQLRRAQMGYAFAQAGRGARGRTRAPRGTGQWIAYAIMWLVLAAVLAFILLALVG